MNKAFVWLLISFCFYKLLLVIMILFKWVFIYPHPLDAFFAAALTLFFTAQRVREFLRKFNENKGLERWRQCSGTAVIALAILTIGSALSILYSQTIKHPVGFYRSPDAKHELVVFNSDGIYTANPCLLRLFYRAHSASYAGDFDKQCSSIKVQWQQDDSALVYFTFDPTAGPVEHDSILVSFDSTTS